MKARARLGVSLSRAHHAFMAFLDRELATLGLGEAVRPGMGHVLFELMSEDDVTLKDLSKRARLAQSTITGIAAKMQAAGLVERRPHETDRRASRLRLTDKARALRPRLDDLDRRCNQAYATALSAGEVTMLVDLLERLRTAFVEYDDRPPSAAPRPGRSRVKDSAGSRSTR